MEAILARILLIMLGIFITFDYLGEDFFITLILLVLVYSGLNFYFAKRLYTIFSTLLFIVACFIWPTLSAFLPLAVFDLREKKIYKFLPLSLLPPLFQLGHLNWMSTALLFALLGLGYFLAHLCQRVEKLKISNRRNRDEAIELQRSLQEKNKSLMESNDSNIHLATLHERNRIAREIHDNVGHLLSRSIMQMGAVQVMNQAEALKAPLDGLKETLDLAMNSVRGSVHDLRDDALDLHAAVYKLLEPLNIDVTFDYELSDGIPNNLKYCFLGVTKEAITNLSKHSNATSLRLSMQEHPAFYQLLIHDNGDVTENAKGPGMGLNNMEDRVTALNGNFNISTENGFKIFASIPKAK